MDILALLQPIQNSVSKTTIRQLSRLTPAMLAITGRVTMLGLSRWTEKGGSYRTVQRFFYTTIPWAQVFWAFFYEHLLDQQDTYLLAGDECVITKAGEKTYGLDCFFSGLLKKAIPGLSFFTLALISVKQRRSYPVCMEQTVRTDEEKAASRARSKAETARPKTQTRTMKGNVTNKAEAMSTRVAAHSENASGLSNHHSGTIHLTYLVLDGHFGNHQLCTWFGSVGYN
jgi:hypothetical protein